MNMREKIARAIAWRRSVRQFGDLVDANKIVDVLPTDEDWEDADAALAAMRGPNLAMLEAGEIGLSAAGVDDPNTTDALYCWQAMLQAAGKGA